MENNGEKKPETEPRTQEYGAESAGILFAAYQDAMKRKKEREKKDEAR